MNRKSNDPVSGIIHFAGAGLAVAATVILIVRVSFPPKPWAIVAFSIFGAGMIAMFIVSGLFHVLPLGKKGLRRFRRVDHIMIYITIACSYTPICLVSLRGGWGWSIFGVIWGLATAGIVFKLIWRKAPEWISTGGYIVMGWSILITTEPAVYNIPVGALIWILASGVIYTAGAVIYSIKKPDPWPGVFGFHEIWHIFVLLGAYAVFVAIYDYLPLFD